MKDLFRLLVRVQREKYQFNVEISQSNLVTFGTRILRIQDQKVWNSMPSHMKLEENVKIFERGIKFWNENTCSSNDGSIFNEASFSWNDYVSIYNRCYGS